MKNQKRALITGVAGQDGAYLAALLRQKNYDVHGLLRWDSHITPLDGVARLDALGLVRDDVTLHTGDILDPHFMTRLIQEVRPDEIYNLAALSHVAVSFDAPSLAFDVNTKATLAILEAIRTLNMQDNVRLYQASSSEMFGNVPAPQNEETAMQPCSPYGVAKLAAYWLCKTYRESYGVFVSNGILFNHESPVRGEDFVTQKIAQHVVSYERGNRAVLKLGNLDAKRDWGHAQDYVRGMWMMMQHHVPDDFVLATGEAHTVRDCVERAFAHIGVPIRWQGTGLSEQAVHAKTGQCLVAIDPALFRPTDINALLGDASKARTVLGWRPHVTFDALMSDMINTQRMHTRHAQADGVTAYGQH